MKNISLYFVPGLLKRQNLKFCIYFLLSNIHNMFRHSALITWYLIYDWQKNHNRSQNKQTQLSLSSKIGQRKWEPSPKGDGKKPPPLRGVPFSLTDWSLSSIVLVAPPCHCVLWLESGHQKRGMVKYCGGTTNPTSHLKSWQNAQCPRCKVGCCGSKTLSAVSKGG